MKIHVTTDEGEVLDSFTMDDEEHVATVMDTLPAMMQGTPAGYAAAAVIATALQIRAGA
jgi:hypothetical protein